MRWGIALITKGKTKTATLDTNNYTSFEHKTWNIHFKSKPTYTITGIYHPPSNCQANDNNSTVLDQFNILLTLLSSRFKNIIILGDINRHIDNIENQDAQMLLDLLAAFNLTQHVQIPIHNRDHTLDVTITVTEDGPFQPSNTIAGPYTLDHRHIILETMETKLTTKIEGQKNQKDQWKHNTQILLKLQQWPSNTSDNTWRGSQSFQSRDAQNPQLSHRNWRSEG